MPDETTVRSAARKIVAAMTGRTVQDSDPLISSGLIDSLSVLRLISQLEQSLNVCIPAQNLQPDDFENIDWIVDTVTRVAVPR